MKTPRLQIADAIATKTLDKDLDRSRLSRSIAAYLLSTNRSAELSSLLRDVQQLRAERGIVEVIAVSAYELSIETKANIIGQIERLYPEAQNIIITEQRDPRVVAGVRLELADRQWDASARGKLNELKQLTTT